MKNVNSYMLKKCIFLTQEEYECIVLSVCGQHSENIPFDELSSALAEYFGVEEVLSIHKDDSEMECVWICYKNPTEKYVLMHTDGYSIDTNIFTSGEELTAELTKQYNRLAPDENDEEFEDMSYLSDDSAILYANGENVYVWDTLVVKEE